MHVLLITQRVDEEHDVLGFTAGWIETLARKVDRVDVLTGYAGEYDLPSNVTVRSFGKEQGYSKPRRILSFERHCLELATSSLDVVFAHMIPAYILGSWPFFELAGKPMVLWYAHGHVDGKLRAAHRLADAIVTSTPQSFRLPSDKLSVVGQGIDTDQFSPGHPSTERNTLLGVGRVMPVKNFELLIDALAVLEDRGHDLTLRIAGDARGDTEYFESVRSRAREVGVAEAVTFLGTVPHKQIVREYRRAGAFLNASETGSLDKTEIEAMACETPTVSSNDSFVEFVSGTGLPADRLTYEAGSTEDLSDTVETLLDLRDDEYAELGRAGRTAVCDHHNVDALMENLVAVFDSVR